jgi:hypothetical protein
MLLWKVMKKILFLFMVFTRSIIAQGDFVDTADANISKAMSHLSGTELVESTYLGIAGSPSENLVHLKVLLRDKNADKLFGELFEKAATNEAKAYALFGLYEIDKKRYKEALKTLGDTNQTLNTAEGCIVETRTLEWALKAIENGKLKKFFGLYQLTKVDTFFQSIFQKIFT